MANDPATHLPVDVRDGFQQSLRDYVFGMNSLMSQMARQINLEDGNTQLFRQTFDQVND